jgi:predicted kinase
MRSGARDGVPMTHPLRPALVVVGGLPATGKSTIAKILAKQTKTPYLRVDRIEQAIVAWSTLSHPVGPAGYAVAYELAQEQLQLRLDVIVECVNPIALTRDSWFKIAAENGAAILEVEVVCSDESEHRRRVETRTSDVEGLTKPTWEVVLERDYEPWTRKHLVVDSARVSSENTAELIKSEIASARRRSS